MNINENIVERCSKYILGSWKSFNQENNKTISRFRMSKDTVKLAADVTRFPRHFIEDLFIKMANLGWCSFLDPDDNFVFISTDSLKNFARLGAARVRKQKEEDDLDD